MEKQNEKRVYNYVEDHSLRKEIWNETKEPLLNACLSAVG